jgi:hypothetical protein
MVGEVPADAGHPRTPDLRRVQPDRLRIVHDGTCGDALLGIRKSPRAAFDERRQVGRQIDDHIVNQCANAAFGSINDDLHAATYGGSETLFL